MIGPVSKCNPTKRQRKLLRQLDRRGKPPNQSHDFWRFTDYGWMENGKITELGRRLAYGNDRKVSEAIKPNWLDWLVYRLFFWRWNRILRGNRKMLNLLIERASAWRAANDPPKGTP